MISRSMKAQERERMGFMQLQSSLKRKKDTCFFEMHRITTNNLKSSH